MKRLNNFLSGMYGKATLFSILCSLLLFTGCEQADELVAITSFQILEPVRTFDGLQVSGIMKSNREINISDFGICYNNSGNPTIEEDRVPGAELIESWEQGQYVVNFTSNLILLVPGTTYYFRAYITTRTGAAYSVNEITFTPVQ
jgi:hypothetical protein